MLQAGGLANSQWAPIKVEDHGYPTLYNIKDPAYSPCGRFALFVTDSHQSAHSIAKICVIDLSTGTIHNYGDLPYENTNAWKYYWLSDGEVIITCPGDEDEDEMENKCAIHQYHYRVNHRNREMTLEEQCDLLPTLKVTRYPFATMHNNVSQIVINRNVYSVVAMCGEFLLLPYDYRMFTDDFVPIRIKIQMKKIDGYEIDLPFMLDGSSSYSPAFFCCGCRIYLPLFKKRGISAKGLPIHEKYFDRFAYLEILGLDDFDDADQIVITEDSPNMGIMHLAKSDPTDDLWTSTSRVKFWQDYRYIVYSAIPGTAEGMLPPHDSLEEMTTSFVIDLNDAKVEKVVGPRKGYSISSMFKGRMMVMNSQRTLGSNLNPKYDKVDYEFQYIS